MSSHTKTSNGDRTRRTEHAVLAPVLFLLGFFLGYLFLVHLLPLGLPDTIVALVSAVVLMTVGLVAHDRMR